jgi:DNA-binding transcriptional ArsR family regulator
MASNGNRVMEELPVFPLHPEEIHPPHVDAAIVTAAMVADRTRARILEVLRDGPRCVCEIAAAAGEPERHVSLQLERLRASGLVRLSQTRAGEGWTFYERDETACQVALDNIREVLG